MKNHLTNSGAVGPLIYLPPCSVCAIATLYQIQEVSKP
jgi:hypothetical protein